MKGDTPLDYAAFQLSPKRTRCEFFVACRGETEKLASGLLKPFVTHLRAAEELVSKDSGRFIKLEVSEGRNAAPWFTKRTLERFVRFVNTPELLELVNAVDVEMTQLEAARNFQFSLYSKVAKEQTLGTGSDKKASGQGTGIKHGESTDAAEASKRELLRAIDVRLTALQQELSIAFARAYAAGFAVENMADLIVFAERFGAARLKDACNKFILLCKRRQDLCSWRAEIDTRSSDSDMSIENGIEGEAEYDTTSEAPYKQGNNPRGFWGQHQGGKNVGHSRAQSTESISSSSGATAFSNWQRSKNAESFPDGQKLKQGEPVNINSSPPRRFQLGGGGMSRSSSYADDQSSVIRHSSNASSDSESDSNESNNKAPEPLKKGPPTRMLSVQERISLFESKQKEQKESTEGAKKIAKTEPRRLSTDSGNSNSNTGSEKAVLKRWSGTSDMSLDLTGSQQTKNDKETGNVSKSEAYITASENSVEKDKDQSQSNVSTPQSEFRPPINNNKPRIIEGKNDSTSHFSSVTRIRDLHQRTWSSTSDVSEASVDQQIPKSVASDFRDANKYSLPIGHMKKSLSTEFREFSSSQNFQEKLTKQSDLGTQETISMEANNSAIPNSRFGISDLNTRREGEKEKDFQRNRQSKGNRERNEELKEKANQLEAMFAAHKLRSQGPSEEGGRRYTAAVKNERPPSSDQQEFTNTDQPKKPISETVVGSRTRHFPPISKDTGRDSLNSSWNNGGEDNMNTLPQVADRISSKNSDKNQEEGVRGKFYERYVERREARLRDESAEKRAQREAKIRALQEILERSKNEMAAAKVARSLEKQDPVLQARLRAEKLRFFNFRVSQKLQHYEAEQSDEEEGIEDSQEQTFSRLGGIAPDGLNPFSSKDQVKSAAKRLSMNKQSLSTTPRNSTSQASPSPRSSVTGKASSNTRRRSYENPLAQSVPSFSDLRKENTKPYAGRPTQGSALEKSSGGGATRAQLKSNNRNKSVNEDFSSTDGSLNLGPSRGGKEDKPRRGQAVRKSYNTMTDLNSSTDGVVLAPLKASKEMSDVASQSRMGRRSANAQSDAKPFLRKGNGIGPGQGPGVAKLKASAASENFKNEDEECEVLTQNDDEEASEIGKAETVGSMDESLGNNEHRRSNTAGSMDAPVDSDDSQNELDLKKDMDLESDKIERVSFHFETSRTQDHNAIPFEGETMHVPLYSSKAPVPLHLANPYAGNVMTESPLDSPFSWNSHAHHSLSQMLEASDVDASADSPMGSPASWNSHSLSQMEASDSDIARTRKKWGSAQKPVIAVSQKDPPKGFRRLLKFGKKSRGADLISTDWASPSTTSEGDEDIEDGRDYAVRSAEDLLRKSRMGFPQGQPAYERSYDYGSSLSGQAENDAFGEQNSINSLRSSIPIPPVNFKLRDDHLSSGSSLKAPRSFFSLSTFRSKGSDSKTR